MQKAIAIDFDGCLCVNKYPEIGEPILHVIDEAKKQQAADAAEDYGDDYDDTPPWEDEDDTESEGKE